RLFTPLFQIRLDLVGFLLFNVVAYAIIAVSGIHHRHIVHHARLSHAAVWRLDEAVVVDSRIAAQRADQSDVRTLRRLDRADAAVVCWVHVADFKSGALTRKTARPER